jgi:hypothetical protein
MLVIIKSFDLKRTCPVITDIYCIISNRVFGKKCKHFPAFSSKLEIHVLFFFLHLLTFLSFLRDFHLTIRVDLRQMSGRDFKNVTYSEDWGTEKEINVLV